MPLRPGTSDKRVAYLVESLVRRLTQVAHRTGPEGQHVDAAIGDYSLSCSETINPGAATRNSPTGVSGVHASGRPCCPRVGRPCCPRVGAPLLSS